MARKRHTEEQIVGVGIETIRSRNGYAELCRQYGISQPTFCKWKAKFGGMEISDARKLAAEFARKHFGLSQRRACVLVSVSRTMFHYQPRLSELNETLRKKLKELAARHRRYGAWKFFKIWLPYDRL